MPTAYVTYLSSFFSLLASFYFSTWYFAFFPSTSISGDEWDAPCVCVPHEKHVDSANFLQFLLTFKQFEFSHDCVRVSPNHS